MIRHQEVEIRNPLDRWILGLILGLLVSTPLLVGTVHAWTILVTSLVAIAALALDALRAIRTGEDRPALTLAGLGLAVGLGFTLVQAVPLPAALVSWLSPAAFELRQFVPQGQPPPSWMPLSLDPAGTLKDALRFGGLLAAFLVAANRLARSGALQRRVCGALVIVAGAISAIGLLHKLLGAQSILGVYDTSAVTQNFFTATFVNPNHLAGYLGLIAPLAIGLAIETRDSWLRPTCVLAAVFIALGAVLSLSRGGIIAFVAGQLFLLALLARRRLGSGRRLALAPLVAGLVVAISAWLAYEEISAELNTLKDPAELSAYDKFQAWKPLEPMARDYWAAGIGRGAFATVYPRYQTLPARGTFTYPENEVLQVLVECGLPVGLLVLGLLGLTLVGLALRARASALACGGLAGLFACSLHNLVDFNLETNAVGLAYFTVLGLLVGQWMRARPEGARIPAWPAVRARTLLVAAALMLVLGLTAGAWAAWHWLPTDTARLHALQVQGGDEAAVQRLALEQAGRRPADYHPAYAAARALYRSGDLSGARRWAERTQRLNPLASEPHELMALILGRSGEHRAAWDEVRRAAERASSGQAALLDRWYQNYPGTLAWLRMTPEERRARLHLARRLLARERPLNAQAALALVLVADPADLEARLLAADAAAGQGRLDEARQHLELARAAHPGRAEPYSRLARLAQGPQRRALLEQGLARLPGDAGLTRELVVELSRSGEHERALELTAALERAAGLDPRQRAAVEMVRGRVELARGKPFLAIEHYTRAVELAPRNPAYRIALAGLFERTGQPELARAEYRVLVRQHPEREDLRGRLEALESKLEQGK